MENLEALVKALGSNVRKVAVSATMSPGLEWIFPSWFKLLNLFENENPPAWRGFWLQFCWGRILIAAINNLPEINYLAAFSPT